VGPIGSSILALFLIVVLPDRRSVNEVVEITTLRSDPVLEVQG
jgi:hypothetical protein